MASPSSAFRLVVCSAMVIGIFDFHVAIGSCQSMPTASQQAILTIVVSDPTGAVVPNAEITLTTEHVFMTKTGPDGSKQVSLPFGTYTVTIRSPGFKTGKVAGLVIESANPPTLSVALELDSTHDPVFVDGVQTITSDVPNVLQPRVGLESLPGPYSSQLKSKMPPSLVTHERPQGPVGRCSENNNFRNVDGRYVVDQGTVSSPLRGWVGYTNTGTPVSEMTIECFSSDGKRRIASAMTDSSGYFSFRKLKPGTYSLKGTKRETGADGSSFQVLTDEIMVSVSTKKSDVVICFVAEAESTSH